MKALPTILLSLVAAAGAVVVYDQLRTDGVPLDPVAQEVVDLGAIRARLDALEAEREPMLKAQGIDPRITERLRELDARLRALESAGRTTTSGEPTDVTGAERDEPFTAGSSDEFDTPDTKELEQFLRLRKAARMEERRRKVTGHIDAALKKSGVALLPRQREQLLDAYEDFRGRRDEIWREAKTTAVEGGGDVDWAAVISNTQVRIQREFSERISTFVPYADAERISQGLIDTAAK